ncbi:MAG TPA: thiamine phosphate synthase [Dongiaceae bacterium]
MPRTPKSRPRARRPLGAAGTSGAGRPSSPRPQLCLQCRRTSRGETLRKSHPSEREQARRRSRPADESEPRGVPSHYLCGATRQPLLDRLQAARLYVVTPGAEPERILDLAEAVLRGGADVVQLRHKTLARRELLDLARRLREVTSAAGALFVVNDYLDLALLSRADGVHLGRDDLSVASARRLAGDRLLIGASASKTSDALAVIAAGADYIGCGATFATPLKPDKGVIGPAGVAAVSRAVTVPVFAIGGIDDSNIEQLTALGLSRVCVIRAVAEAADPESAARRLRTILGG